MESNNNISLQQQSKNIRLINKLNNAIKSLESEIDQLKNITETLHNLIPSYNNISVYFQKQQSLNIITQGNTIYPDIKINSQQQSFDSIKQNGNKIFTNQETFNQYEQSSMKSSEKYLALLAKKDYLIEIKKRFEKTISMLKENKRDEQELQEIAQIIKDIKKNKLFNNTHQAEEIEQRERSYTNNDKEMESQNSNENNLPKSQFYYQSLKIERKRSEDFSSDEETYINNTYSATTNPSKKSREQQKEMERKNNSAYKVFFNKNKTQHKQKPPEETFKDQMM